MADCDHGVPLLCAFSFFAAARDEFFMSKTASLHIVRDGLGVLVPMPDGLARSNYNLGFFPIVLGTGFDPVLAEASFCRRQEIDWSYVDLKGLLLLNSRRAGQVIRLARQT